ncbi:unnamed protein product [Fusarium graminearum]|uniref:Uncharacterized protein n=1 Tax=Gibberella zeae TaxID=5518 RepID=A0A679NLP1_GIBZA|nr:unnamed protein product [Fusarium graminearum]CAF3624762.1 unnamed protein product [Fusarium graminearum]CAG1971873.1 unnamed protein product [Fusarium graminearum]CAG2009368.1 unnamed protein product [Fusarium graminearum]CZS74754.1 unnamed protein product [Fusarium graminearum]
MLRIPAFRVYGPARNIPEWWIFNGRAKTINENKGSGAKTIVASSARILVTEYGDVAVGVKIVDKQASDHGTSIANAARRFKASLRDEPNHQEPASRYLSETSTTSA